jgi:hypothetical protein
MVWPNHNAVSRHVLFFHVANPLIIHYKRSRSSHDVAMQVQRERRKFVSTHPQRRC